MSDAGSSELCLAAAGGGGAAAATAPVAGDGGALTGRCAHTCSRAARRICLSLGAAAAAGAGDKGTTIRY